MTAKRKKKPNKRRRLWIFLLILIVGAFALLQTPLAKKWRGGNDALGIRIARIERIDELRSEVSANGQIQAHDSVDIQTEIAGIIIELPVEEGDRVEVGQVLIEIDPEQTLSDVRGAEAQLDASIADAHSAKARVASAIAEVAQANFQLKFSEVTLEQNRLSMLRSAALQRRQKELFEDDLVSPEEYEIAEIQARLDNAKIDAATAAVEEAKARIKSMEVAVKQVQSRFRAAESRAVAASATVERLKDLLEKTTIRSPIDGLIIRRNVDIGERAVPGVLSNPHATLLTIANLSEIEAHIAVDETDIVRVSLNDLATVTVDALPDEPLIGSVTEIANSPINPGASNAAKNFKVVVRLHAPHDALRTGLSCNAEIAIDTRNNILVVPIAALVIRESYVDENGEYLESVKKGGKAPTNAEIQAAREDGGEAAGEDKREKKEIEGVFVKDNNNIARFRPVKTGITGEIEIELIEGLSDGDVIITGPFKTLRTVQDGDLVRIRDSHRPGEDKP